MRQASAAEAHRKPCIQAWGPRRLPRTPPDRGTCRSIAPLLRASKQGRLAVAIRGLSLGSSAMSSWPRSNSLHSGPAGPGCKIYGCLTEHKPIRRACLGSPRHLKSSDHSRRPNVTLLRAVCPQWLGKGMWDILWISDGSPGGKGALDACLFLWQLPRGWVEGWKKAALAGRLGPPVRQSATKFLSPRD